MCSIMPENFEDRLEEKILENKTEINEQVIDNRYVIIIPSHAKKDDLLELKVFMQGLYL
ncbi:MAG: hypothetical protein Q8S84_06555 [bacterium]|nr:hypothetical protein [bacterium]